MKYKNTVRYIVSTAIFFAVGSFALAVSAQEKSEAKAPAVGEKSSAGRDPFRKYAPVIKGAKSTTKLEAPSIQERIDRYRAQKMAAANAHVAAPKPTTALLLSEVQVTGIFRTPRGWSAMVEAMPLSPKLSYVIYPGENFFDGQLVAIEENRLIFRRDVIWADGRKEKTVEIKPLRAPTVMETMTAAKTTPTETPAPETAKPGTPDKQ